VGSPGNRRFGGFVPQAGLDEALAGVAAALEDGAQAVSVVEVIVFGAARSEVGGVGGGGFGDEIEQMERAPVVVKEEVAGVERGLPKGAGDGGEFLDEFDASTGAAGTSRGSRSGGAAGPASGSAGAGEEDGRFTGWDFLQRTGLPWCPCFHGTADAARSITPPPHGSAFSGSWSRAPSPP
jgi:hypothetical protein